jgi:hypothetical protein
MRLICWVLNTALGLLGRPLAVATAGREQDALRLAAHILVLAGVEYHQEASRIVIPRAPAVITVSRRFPFTLVRMEGPPASAKWRLIVQIVRKQVRSRAWRDLGPRPASQ